MEEGPSSEADCSLDFYGTWRFITVVTRPYFEPA
jgi:hypothetical protein